MHGGIVHLISALLQRKLKVSPMHGKDTLLKKLQSVQNAAARLLTQTGRREHITPVLRQLQWLPVSRRIDFKLAVLITTFHADWLPRTCKTGAIWPVK